MKKIIIGSIIVLTAIAVGFFIITRTTSAPSNGSAPLGSSSTDIISPATVATHDSKGDCWTIITGSVYDITAYVSEHPGGDVISQACGTDGTRLFSNREGDGEGHSPTADAILAKYKIGTLTN